MTLSPGQVAALPVVASAFAGLREGWYAVVSRAEWATVAPALAAKGIEWAAHQYGAGVAVFADGSPDVPAVPGAFAPGYALAAGFLVGADRSSGVAASDSFAATVAEVLAKTAAHARELVTATAAITDRVQAVAAGKTVA